MESISSDSDCDSVASYADVVKGESLFSSSPARLTNSCWFKFQVESEEEAMQIALKKSASDAQGDEISDDDSLETTTPGFKEISKPRVKDFTLGALNLLTAGCFQMVLLKILFEIVN
ncbi:hypothetical protein ACROYT_G003071 [Oculina patagonica]